MTISDVHLLSIFLLKCLFIFSAYSMNCEYSFTKECETKICWNFTHFVTFFNFLESFLILEVYVLIVFSFFMLCIT